MKTKQVLISLSILGISGLGFIILKASRPETNKKEAKELSYLVKVDTLRAGNENIYIPISGEIKAAHEYSITSQVSGKANIVSDRLVTGAKFKKGDFLFSVDPREYEAELDKKESSLNIARYNLDLIEEKAKVGVFAWELENKNLSENEKEKVEKSKGYSLATGLVEQDKQEENVNVALNDFALKELDVEKTRFIAPCDGVVLFENIDEGQLVRGGDTPVKYVCTDYFYLESDIISNKLQFLEFDRKNNIKSDVIVHNTDVGLEKNGYKGKILNFIPQVTKNGRLARALIKIFNPMQYEVPLFIGSFVEGIVKGKALENIFKIKRDSLRNENTVWLVDGQNRMKILKVNVAFADKDFVYVDKGLQNGDRIVTSKVPTAVNGLKLEISQ